MLTLWNNGIWRLFGAKMVNIKLVLYVESSYDLNLVDDDDDDNDGWGLSWFLLGLDNLCTVLGALVALGS